MVSLNTSSSCKSSLPSRRRSSSPDFPAGSHPSLLFYLEVTFLCSSCHGSPFPDPLVRGAPSTALLPEVAFLCSYGSRPPSPSLNPSASWTSPIEYRLLGMVSKPSIHLLFEMTPTLLVLPMRLLSITHSGKDSPSLSSRSDLSLSSITLCLLGQVSP